MLVTKAFKGKYVWVVLRDRSADDVVKGKMINADEHGVAVLMEVTQDAAEDSVFAGLQEQARALYYVPWHNVSLIGTPAGESIA